MLVYVRPSNERCFIVGVPRAQGANQAALSPVSTDDARYRTAQWDSGIGAHLI